MPMVPPESDIGGPLMSVCQWLRIKERNPEQDHHSRSKFLEL